MSREIRLTQRLATRDSQSLRNKQDIFRDNLSYKQSFELNFGCESKLVVMSDREA